MRTFSFTKDEFDQFLYTAFVTGSAENEEELEIATRIRFKMRQIASPETISSEELASATKNRKKILPLLKLNDENNNLSLEEDEYKLITKRLIAYIPQISLAASEELYDFIQSVKNSTPTKV